MHQSECARERRTANEADVLPILFVAFVTAVTVSPKVPFVSDVMPVPLAAHAQATRSRVGM